jgi:hypothetical protein
MTEVERLTTVGSAIEEDAKHLLRLLEVQRIFNQAVRETQERNRRLGIPNYYELKGRILSDQLDNN